MGNCTLVRVVAVLAVAACINPVCADGKVSAEVARATGDRRYAARARAIVRQTLGLFEPDGRAHCVFICPDRVDGKPGKVFDPLMNDQDWALAFYLAIVR